MIRFGPNFSALLTKHTMSGQHAVNFLEGIFLNNNNGVFIVERMGCDVDKWLRTHLGIHLLRVKICKGCYLYYIDCETAAKFYFQSPPSNARTFKTERQGNVLNIMLGQILLQNEWQRFLLTPIL
jgi:hypothetical protein